MANTILGYVVVFLGAGIGGSLRHAVNRTTLPFGSAFPWATFVVNVSGSLLMGLVAGWFAFRAGGATHTLASAMPSPGGGQHYQLFLATGVLGGYTTFSAFSLDAVMLWERGRIASAAVYAAGSVLLSVAALAIGIAVIRH